METELFDLPIPMKGLTPQEIAWMAVKSSDSGKSTSEVVRDLVRQEVARLESEQEAESSSESSVAESQPESCQDQ